MHRRGRKLFAYGFLAVSSSSTGCVSIRRDAPSVDLRPCTDGFAYTEDGWRLGVRHYRSPNPDPGKLPVILCHGLGLNATFWTITDNHLASQLALRGYDVFVFDIRGSGENAIVGRHDRINRIMRHTFLRECGERRLDRRRPGALRRPGNSRLRQAQTGRDRVQLGRAQPGWNAHLSLPGAGTSSRADRQLRWHGKHDHSGGDPQRDMLAANRGLRILSLFASPGRLGRPLTFFRLPGMELIDRFYYSPENVDRETISRFYGYTLEDTGPGALRQLDPYLEYGHMLSADRTIDYSSRLGEIQTPTLLVAGDGDIMSDVPSTELTFAALGSPDKAIMRFGKSQGHIADYGHCDLVWSRHAPKEIFPPIIDWLDQRQPAPARRPRQSAR